MKDLSALKNHVIIALKPFLRMEVQGNGILKVKQNSSMSARSTYTSTYTTPRHEYENPETT